MNPRDVLYSPSVRSIPHHELLSATFAENPIPSSSDVAISQNEHTSSMQVQSEASTEMDAQDTMVDFSDFLCDLDHDEEDRPDNYSEEQGTDNPPDNTDRVEHPGLELDNRGSQNVTRQDAQQLRVPIRGVAQIDTNMPASITQLPGRLGIDLTPAAVYDIFRSKGPIFDVKILCNLTLFFFGLASAEGIWQMREFCNQSAFETTPMIREPTVVQTLQAGGQAKAGNAKSAFEMRVNRSWLVEHRNRRKQYYQSQDGGRKRRKGMHRSEYSRPDSRAFREITSEAYAEQVPPKQSYRLLHTLVKNELALGRHWYSLKESFSRGMSLLAVIPPTGPYFVSDTA